MTEIENILRLADRDLAAGRYADAEAGYTKVLESDPDRYAAVHGRGVARAWRSSLFEGDLTAVLSSTDDALRLCRRNGGDEEAFLRRAAVDLINLTSTKYNELTRIYTSVARKENQKAPSPMFAYTWSPAKPQGLALSDLYLPLINYLASIIRVSEYLDGLVADRRSLLRSRRHNAGNLSIFCDWLIAFNATGRVASAYYMEITQKKRALTALRAQLEQEAAEPEYRAIPGSRPEEKPAPEAEAEADEETGEETEPEE